MLFSIGYMIPEKWTRHTMLRQLSKVSIFKSVTTTTATSRGKSVLWNVLLVRLWMRFLGPLMFTDEIPTAPYNPCPCRSYLRSLSVSILYAALLLHRFLQHPSLQQELPLNFVLNIGRAPSSIRRSSFPQEPVQERGGCWLLASQGEEHGDDIWEEEHEDEGQHWNGIH